MTIGVGLAPHVDRSGEPWVGTFPGLGSVRVHADGSYQVEVAESVDEGARDALAFGWAEPLSFVRRGLRLAHATTLVPPAPINAGCALMLSGRQQCVSEVALLLADLGWRLLAHGFTPIQTTSEVIAHPRPAPWIAPRHLLVRSDLVDGTRIRPGATAQRVHGDRYDVPIRVAARVTVTQRDAVTAEDEVVAPVRGRERMTADHQVVGPSEAGQWLTAEQLMREEMVLAQVPLARLYWPSTKERAESAMPDALARLVEWWSAEAS